MDIVSSFAPSVTRGYDFPDAKRALKSKIAELDSGDLLTIDDLLDFSNDDIGGPVEVVCPPGKATTLDVKLSSCSWIDRKHSQAPSIFDTNGPGELCVPCDDLEELEWLSNFVEESFSSGDAPADALLVASVRAAGFEGEKTDRVDKEQYERASPVSVLDSSTYSSGNVCMSSSTDISVPGRARSKRCRTPVCFWNTRIFSGDASASILECSSTSNVTAADLQSSDSEVLTYEHSGADSFPAKKLCKGSHSKAKKELDTLPARRCLHCSIQRTPQWRAGPMGPKTLCNACGVRYKSGRLLPEYRPAASPTFIETIHSNSHRRVLEMRREKADEFTTTQEDQM